MKTTALSTLLISLALGVVAEAAVVVDQEQTFIGLGSLGIGFDVGGPAEFQVGQTVTAGVDGRLVRIEVPVACDSGRLIVEIVDVDEGDVPGTTVLARAEVDGSAFPMSEGFIFRSIDIEPNPRMSAGDRFAIVYRNETGRCGVGMGSSVDLYTGGRSVFRDTVRPVVWTSTGGFLDPIDSSFRTFVDTGRGERPCVVRGLRDPLPFDSFTPVCRCLQDASLREFRCGLFHPSLFLFRRVPFPIRAGEPFTVRWTLVALGPIKGSIELQDVFPKDYTGQKIPLVFFGEQVPVGQSLTLEYKAVAGPKSGLANVDTNITIKGPKPDEGRLTTTIEVIPK